MMQPIECLRSSTAFASLSEDRLAGLSRACRLVRIKADETIFRAGDEIMSIFVVCDDRNGPAQGPLVQMGLGDGPATWRAGYRLLCGELFGEIELFAGKAGASAPKRISWARALAPVTLIEVPLEALAELLGEARFIRRLARGPLSRLLEVVMDQAARRTLHPEISFAIGLLDLLDDYGKTVANRGVFSRKLSQQEVADALGLSRRMLSLRLSDWSARGMVETIPLRILDVARVERIASLANPVLAAALAAAMADVENLLDRGLAAAASQAASDMLEILPGNPVFLHLLGLAAIRMGAVKQAKAIASSAGLAWDGSLASLKARLRDAWTRSLQSRHLATREVDEDQEAALRRTLEQRLGVLSIDVGALHARILKESLFQLDPQSEAFGKDARAAADLYAKVHEASPNHYCAVNAATLHFVVGDHRRAVELATAVRRLADKEPSGYWSFASHAEASLLLGDRAAAISSMDKARKQPDADLAKLTSTRRQLKLVNDLSALDARAVSNRLDPGRPVFFSGPLFRHTDGSSEALAAAEAELAARLRSWLSGRIIPAVFSAAACGADILFAEAALDAGVPLHIVLPMPVGRFVDLSVRIGGGHWEERFYRCLDRADSIVELWREEGSPSAMEQYFLEGNRHMAGQVIFTSYSLLVDPVMLAVLDGSASRSIAGSRHQVDEFRDLGHEVSILPAPFMRPGSGAGPRSQSPFTPVVFAFSGSQQENLAAEAVLGETGFHLRTMKDKRIAGHRLAGDFAEALNTASLLCRTAADRALSLRVVCDFGPVRHREGPASHDAILKLEAAGDVTAVAAGDVFATVAFVMADLARGGAPARYTAIPVATGAGLALPEASPRGSRAIYRYTNR